MAGLSCAEVRAYLTAVRSGSASGGNGATFSALQAHGAVGGSAALPSLTPVGQHVLSELEVRAYRVDTLPLEFVAAHLDRILGDLDHVAKTAEYFLAELGPVAPPEVLPLLRPVAVSLANRRETPDELAEEFRQDWGSTEVMGGAAIDRLLAAELLCASSAEIAEVYAPMNITASRLRERLGERVPAVTVAALLHLHPKPNGSIALDEYYALRPIVTNEEAAAVLATQAESIEGAKGRFEGFRDELVRSGATDPIDARLAAVLLAANQAPLQSASARVAPIARGLGSRVSRPFTAAAVLAGIELLSPEELLNWFEKASDIARSHRLAPTPMEIATLGASMVAGLPPEEFSTGFDVRGPPPIPLAGLVALHAWVYRPLVRPAAPSTAAPAAAP